MTLTLGQIRAQVRSGIAKAKQKRRRTDRFGLFAAGGWTGPSEVEIDGKRWRIAEARSVLAAREILTTAEDEVPLLLVSRVPGESLGYDVLARFGVVELLKPNRIETLKDLFQATSIDPRLLHSLAVVDQFTSLSPDLQCPGAPNGHLSAQTFWNVLLKLSLGIEGGTPDLQALLRWSLMPGATDRFRTLDDALSAHIVEWIETASGSAAAEVLRSIEKPGNPHPVVLGLALGDAFHPGSANDAAVVQAKVRMERYFDQVLIAPDRALAWAAASSGLMDSIATTQGERVRPLSREFDQLLAELRIVSQAEVSPWSTIGLDAQFDGFGHDLQRFVAMPTRDSLGGLATRIERIKASRLAAFHQERVVRLEMAARLSVWLLRTTADPSAASPQSLPDAVSHYLTDASYADWARTTLYGSDPSGPLAEAFKKLLQAVFPNRQRFNESYAGLLSTWTTSAGGAGRITAIHQVIPNLIGPAREASSLLVIVLDGLSVAVFNELIADLGTLGWQPIAAEGQSRPLVISALPSITNLSRTSLLSGTLQMGGQAQEVAGFTAHPDLQWRTRSGSPRLFHKADLISPTDGSLSTDVGEAIASSARVVGVVINAVDDHLANGEQLSMSWRADSIRSLTSLLARARDAGRLVVLVSDHGHLLDHGTQATTGSESARYRSTPPAASDGEILIHAARTGLGVDQQGLVLAWSESLRYGDRKNG
ncbi:MAG: BREX-2 system phosphatase PglZ, partial [Planctomycetota bacterium]|nr:BREX-2 system phosphatase PglZ [Planctomycetota bacterium]